MAAVQIEKASIEFTIQESSELTEVIDFYIRGKGLNGADKAIYFSNKLAMAFIPRQLEPKKNNDDAIADQPEV